jgi:hypothetical protein
MLKYLTKFALDVLPSVVATILGAYIVNHYINTKSDTDAPAAAVASTADPKNQKIDPKLVDVAKIPEPGVKAKGISERAMIEKSASEGPAEVKPVETKPAETKPAENKSGEVKPAETAIAPAEPRRAPPAREKALAKATPNPAAASVATANPASAAEANATPEERRDANDLARAAIERLRGAAANSQEATRQPERSQDRTQDRAIGERTTGISPVRPLPPPIAVAAPPADGNNVGSPPYTASIRNDDPNRPTPPAEIPSPPPLDLRAAANEAATAKDRAKAVAQDMLSAAKSMFHTVLPQ